MSPGHTSRVRRAAAIALLVLLAGACADPAVTTARTGDAPDALEIRCDGETTEVLTPIVQAQRDGVHVLIHNTLATETLSVSTETAGDGAPPGETTLIFPINPGRSRIRCLKETEDHAMENGDWGPFEVLAPDVWVSPVFDCPNGSYAGFRDPAPGARGVGDPAEDAEKHFREEGTVLEAGYQTADARTFINAVDGNARESLTYTSDGYGGWLQTESSGCSD
jgi:hypothetical protein